MILSAQMPSCCRSARFWGLGVAVWFLLLCFLSHGDHGFKPDLGVQNLDKVAHFGYFFGGGGLLAAVLFFCFGKASWGRVILLTTLILACVGVFDEWHQSFFPTRSGNDPFDWTADVLGALSGALVFKAIHHVLLAKKP